LKGHWMTNFLSKLVYYETGSKTDVGLHLSISIIQFFTSTRQPANQPIRLKGMIVLIFLVKIDFKKLKSETIVFII
ncbi:9344_t:CDS:1, partial [Racocetra persica]